MTIDKLLLANRNTKPEGGKTAVPTGINNAQTTYSQKPCPTVKGYVPVVPYVRITGNEDVAPPVFGRQKVVFRS